MSPYGGVQTIYGWQSDPTHWTYLGEGANDTDPCIKDTDGDGLWDGPSPTATLSYTGWLRLGKDRLYVLDGKPYGDYENVDLSGMNLRARGELTYGTNPNNKDTDNDSFFDGEEVVSFLIDDKFIPRDDYVAGSPWSAQYPLFSIDTGSWVKIPLYVDNQLSGLDFLLTLTTVITGEGNQANLSIKVTPKGDEATIEASYSKWFVLAGNAEVYHYPYRYYGKDEDNNDQYCCKHNIPLGELNVGSYLINISYGNGDTQSRYAILGEMLLSTRAFYGSDPASNDTDDDGLNDTEELELETSVKRDDTDWDYWYDGDDDWPAERDVDGDLLTYPRELYYETDHLNPDCDDDLLSDYQEVIVWGSNPWNANSDTDTLTDGYEVLGWDCYTITDREAICVPEGTVRKLGSITDCIVVEHVLSNPTLSDTDSDGMNDFLEFTCSTNPRTNDTDCDLILDNYDPEKDIVDIEGPEITIDWMKPERSFEITCWVRSYDKAGLAYTELYKDDKLLSSWTEPGLTASEHEARFRLDVSECLDMPVLTVYSTDRIENVGKKAQDMGKGAFERAEIFVGQQVGRILGPDRGGFVAGFTTSFLDTVASTVDMLESLGSGKNLEMMSKMADGFQQNGLGAFSDMIAAVAQKQDEQNPYDAQTEGCQRETFKWSWAAGYIAGIIVTAYAGAKGANCAVSAFTAELAGAGSIGAKMAEWGAKFAGLSRGAKLVIMVGVQAGTAVALKLLFPELFSSWLSAGFGAVMCTQYVTDHINTGISQVVLDKVKTMAKASPLFKNSIGKIWGKYLGKNNIWTKADYEQFINRVNDVIDIDKVEPRYFADLIQSSKNKWGINLIDEVLEKSDAEWENANVRWRLAQIIDNYGPNHQVIYDINNLKLVPRVDNAINNLGSKLGKPFAKGHLYELRFASKLKDRGSQIIKFNHYEDIEFLDPETNELTTARLDIDVVEIDSTGRRIGNEIKDTNYLTKTKQMKEQVLKMKAKVDLGELHEARIIVKNGNVSQSLRDYAKTNGISIYDDALNLLNP